jgi:hypothetical protein
MAVGPLIALSEPYWDRNAYAARPSARGPWLTPPAFELPRKVARMPNQSVVLLGNLPVELAPLDRVVTEFGWSLKRAATFDQLRQPRVHRDALAVPFEASMWDLSWRDALRLVRDAAPTARPILCHRLSATLDWPELSAARAFHTLAIPLDSAEARQSLGFVRAAKRPPANVLALPSLTEWPSVEQAPRVVA